MMTTYIFKGGCVYIRDDYVYIHSYVVYTAACGAQESDAKMCCGVLQCVSKFVWQCVLQCVAVSCCVVPLMRHVVRRSLMRGCVAL